LDQGLEPQEVIQMSAAAFEKAGISADLSAAWAKALRTPDTERRVDEELALAEKGRFLIVLGLDADYPERLRSVPDRPPVLYVRGRWPIGPDFRLGIVGTRHPTLYGEKAARYFSEHLVMMGVQTVSGLAAGVDTIVHEATVKAGGWTVAALGHGLSFQFPRQNARLFEVLAEQGTLVTEFPYSCPPDAALFPRRNRIISGLSNGVLVIQAGERSGALITARFAAEQGREVFAVPGDIFTAQSAGPHRLLANGAKMVTQPEDILSEYGVQSSIARVKSEISAPLVELSGLEKRVYDEVSSSAVSVDELAAVLGAPVDQLASALLSLELKGLACHLPGQRYARTNG
jgi:DNA processing protein